MQCSVLQCGAACCSMLQFLHCAVVCESVLQCIVLCYSVLQLLQCVAVCCSVVQRAAVQGNVLSTRTSLECNCLGV